MGKLNNQLKEILRFDKAMKGMNCGLNPVRRAIMGHYGEILVARELEKRGFKVEQKGNLAGYDLLVNGKKIEVRTSEKKKERAFPKKISAWGWKLQSRNESTKQPIPLKYDHIVLVKLGEDWKESELFVMTGQDVENMDSRVFNGYQTVAKSIYLFDNCMSEALIFDRNRKKGDLMITPTCVKFNENPNIFRMDLEKFGNLLKD